MLPIDCTGPITEGIEAMLNGVVTRINSFIETLNAALALLPDHPEALLLEELPGPIPRAAIHQ